jgi:hypothetical protein
VVSHWGHSPQAGAADLLRGACQVWGGCRRLAGRWCGLLGRLCRIGLLLYQPRDNHGLCAADCDLCLFAQFFLAPPRSFS